MTKLTDLLGKAESSRGSNSFFKWQGTIKIAENKSIHRYTETQWGR